jgi:hypothetical protein
MKERREERFAADLHDQAIHVVFSERLSFELTGYIAKQSQSLITSLRAPYSVEGIALARLECSSGHYA